MRSCWKFPLCPICPVAAGSKVDPLLVKAGPISNGGSTSDNTVKKVENNLHNSNCSHREE